MQVYRARDPDGHEWRIEIDDPPDVRVRVFVARGRLVSGTGIKMDGVGALGKWLVEHGMGVDDLQPW
jgi:hypothetical protein